MKTRVTLTIALAAGMTALPAISQAASHSAVPAPLEYLRTLQNEASNASAHAAKLESLASSPYAGYVSHGAALEELKADINSMGQTLSQLEQVRESATPEELNASARAFPLLKLMTQNANAAFEFLNKNQGEFWKPAYRSAVANLATEASQLKQTLGLYVKLANARFEEKSVETHLGVEAGS